MGPRTAIAAKLPHEAFEAQVRRTPGAIATVTGPTRLTYVEVNRRANRLAHTLRRRGVGRGDLVGVCLPRDHTLVPALLAVLKAGAAYVPLDPAHPPARRALIIEDARLRHMITSAGQAGDATAVTEADEDAPDTDPEPLADAGDAAYVIYTSGTTGRPKGAVTEHRQVMNLLDWARATYSDGELRGSLCAASVCHDFSVVEIFPSLVTGGTVILAQNMLELPHLQARDEVTMISGVPSAISAMMRDPLPPGLRTISVGGEVVSRALADRMYANPGVRRVLHMYGPTECTTYSTMYEVPRIGSGPLPLGGPVAGARLSIRDDSGAPVPDGTVGELWIAGPVVVRGYLNRPELTAEKFVDLPGGGRAYRSGDLARVENGQWYIHGRADDQVKVRGYRVELGEVEVCLGACPGVGAAVARADGETLFAYVEAAGEGVDERGLKEFLRARLPDYMVPSRIAVLDRIPLGPTGKADRGALAKIEFPQVAGVDEARDEVERAVARIMADALGRREIGVFDRFGDLGGHSLAATRAVAAIREDFGVGLTLARFMSLGTAAAVAGWVRHADRAGAPVPVVRHRERESYPLTDMQRSFWTIRELSDRPDATTTAVRLRVTGPVGEAMIRDALEAIVTRHEVLRTAFTADGGPVTARPTPPRPVPMDAHESDGFDLSSGRLLRAAWRPRGDGAAAGERTGRDGAGARAEGDGGHGDAGGELLVVADHIAFDGWSVGVLMRELADHLSGRPMDDPAVQVGDVALHERERDPGHAAYWRRRLDGVTAPHDLPGVPVSGRGPGRAARSLSDAMTARIRDVAASLGVTPFALYLAALGVMISGHTSRRDTLLGAPFVRRDQAGLAHVIGPLMGTLPVRLDVDPGLTFGELARAAANEVAQGLSHTDASFADMTETVIRPPGSPTLPVLLSMQPDDSPVVVESGRIRVELLGELRGGAGPDTLALFLNRTVTGTELIMEYPDGRFTDPGAAAFVDDYLRVLEFAASEPGVKVGRIDLVGEAERRRLLRLGCPAATGEPVDPVGAVLAEARRDPGRCAVDAPDGEMTYGELDEMSARIAGGLARQGVLPGEVVGVCLPRGRLLPAALLGVLRAGAAYLPLDPEHPRARRDHQIADCGARVVLDDRAVGVLARDEALTGTRRSELAYVLYTSGSTGRPKGVDVLRESLGVNLAAMRDVFGARAGDVTLSVSPMSFDVAHLGMWLPLSTGGRCVLIDGATGIDGYALAVRVRDAGVTGLFAPPTTLRMLVAAGWTGGERLRVMSAGEVLDPVLARQVLPLVDELWNGYGPTEAAIITTMHRVSAPVGETVPIGRPLPGYRVYLTGDGGRLVPQGVTGELWIAGPAVARGYRNRPELTAESFREEPYGDGIAYRTGDLARWRPDGTIDYLGRRDFQTKIRGYRVELGEVEACLREHPAVADAAAAAAHGAAGETHLVGYVVWREPGDPADLERFLRDRLPDYMTPRRWVGLDRLPLNHNGKLDRSALPAPAAHDLREAPLTTPMQQMIADIWREVLERQSVSATDDFFALGGHSFAATRVMNRLWNVLGCRIPVKALFDHPVLAAFADEVERLALAHLSAEPR